MSRPTILVLFLAALMVMGAFSGMIAPTKTISGEQQVPLIASQTSDHPAQIVSTAHFTENLGQWPAFVHFKATISFGEVWFTDGGLIFEISSDEVTAQTMRIGFQNGLSVPIGLDRIPMLTNYFVGDPSTWRSDVGSYVQIKYPSVWPGIDIVYRFDGQTLKYDLRVDANADLKRAVFAVDGAALMKVDGELWLDLGNGIVINDGAPIATYDDDGTCIPVQYRLSGTGYGFDAGAYDIGRDMTIDPLVYSTFVGGRGSDQAMAVAVDAQGNAYVAGVTSSDNFPITAGSYQQTIVQGTNDLTNAFVLKLDPTGSNVIYSTYIGGSGFDQAVGIAVDAQGNAYVAGFTNSANFPTTTSGLQRTLGGDPRVDDDVFVLKLNPAGSTLVYSTYVGGSGFERASGITIDTDGNAYVAGFTDSTNFPTTTGAYQRTYAGGDQYGGGDAFVLKLDPIGSTLIYSTYIGKNTNDMATAITLDPQRNAYVTGYTDATDFPTSLGAFQTKNGGIGDVFIVKLDQTGSTLLYSTLVGGSTDDYAMGITADDQGTVYVTGYTLSSDFPVTNGSFQETFKGVFDAFVLKLDQTGSNLLYSTFVGGSTYDKAYSIAVDAEGIAYVTGSSNSVDFPTTYGAFQSGKLGSTDAFLFKLDHNGSHLINSSYLGGRAWSEAYAIDLDDQGGAYLAGFTSSTNFPVSENGFQRSFAGGYDAFMTKMAVADALPGPPIDLQGTSGYDQVTLTWRSPVMNGGGVDYYAVYQDEVDVAHSSTTTAMITGLTSGQSYDFWVRAHNSAGLGPASGTNTSSPSVDVVPGQPTGLHAVILDQQVTLGWDPPANNGTLPLIGYYVYYGESSADTRFGDLVPVGTNTSVISNLTSGAWYYFAVSAVSPVGEGARSSNVSVLINEINTTITGKVVDSAGEPLPDIRVELENGTYAITDAQGHFDLNTTPGNHTLTISGEGIKTEIINKTVPPGGMDLGTLSVTKAEEPSEPGDAMVYLVIAAVLALSAIGIAMIILARRRRGPKDQM